MRKIMLRVKPWDVANILNGKKNIEIRKNMPSCELPCEVYIYCDSHNNYTESLYEVCGEEGGGYDVDYYRPSEPDFILNEKVVAKFTLNKIEEICCEGLENGCIGDDGSVGYNYFYSLEDGEDIRKKACLDEFELRNYLGIKLNGEVVGYAWHISHLKIFKKPKRIWEYNKKDTLTYEGITTFARAFGDKYVKKVYGDRGRKFNYGIKKAPSNWCYIKVGG